MGEGLSVDTSQNALLTAARTGASEDTRSPFGIHYTKRYVSLGGESRLYVPHVISARPRGEGTSGEDAGVTLVDYIGGDPVVARVATAGLDLDVFPERPALSAFLEHIATKHIHTPFKSTQLKFQIQCPIEVALELVYLQSASVNEYSGRYSVMLATAQGSTEEELRNKFGMSAEDARRVATLHQAVRGFSTEYYAQMLHVDMARELARSGLGTDNDTRFYLKLDIASLATLVSDVRHRLPLHSPVRDYVEAMSEIAGKVAPHAWSALANRGNTLKLTMPRDEDVVDQPLRPPSWPAAQTRRAISGGIEGLLFAPLSLLDGQIQAVDYMGDDSSLAQAARVSYGSGTKKLSDDIQLIRSLVRDDHTSPIEMAELAVEAKTPVFTDPRQAKRHRTLDREGFMGYVPVGKTFYMPPVEQMKYQDRVNRQGRGKGMDKEDLGVAFRALERSVAVQQFTVDALREVGAPEEIVRAIRGVGHYTRGWRTGDALSWGKFFKLRSDPHAQFEVQVYSRAAETFLSAQLPETYKAMRDYWFDAVRFSSLEQDVLANVGTFDSAALAPTLLLDKRFSMVDKEAVAKGVAGARKLNREGEGFVKKLERLAMRKVAHAEPEQK